MIKKEKTDQIMRRLYTLLLVLALAAFILVNLCAQLADHHFGLSLDLTENRLYHLSDLTADVCVALTEPVHVYIVSAQSDYPAMLHEMLMRYTHLSHMVAVEYVDPYTNPVFLEHYAQMGLQLSERDLLIEGAWRFKTISYDQLLLKNKNGDITGIDLEQQLTSALLYVNSNAMPEATFITGHNERPSTALRRLFESNSFVLRDVALLTGDNISGTSIVVVAAPTRDYTPEEIKKLADYLATGGKMIVFLEPGPAALPNLEAFLAGWGIVPESDLVFEPTASVAGNPLNLIPMYASHAITAFFINHSIYVVMPASRSLTLSMGAQAVLHSTRDAYCKKSVQYTTSKQEPDDLSGRVALAAVAEKKLADNQTAMVFVAGSRMIFADDLMQATTYANSLFLSQVISYLYADVQTLSLPPKTLSASPLPVTHTQALAWGAGLIIMPLCVLIIGFWTVRQRKRL
jgi:ABC-2 type transport system permease protein